MLRVAVNRVLSASRASFSTMRALTSLSEDDVMFKNMAEKFAREEIRPLVLQMDAEEKFDDSLVKKLFANGFMGLELDGDKYDGGANATFFQSLLAIEEIARVDPSIAILVDIQNTLINRLVTQHGTEEQKAKWLPRLAKDTVGSFCLSEPGSGSDAFAMKTRAVKKGNKYVINGSKIWISHGDIAGLLLLMANAAPERGYKGITCFLIDTAAAGDTFSVAKKEKKLGLKASGTCVLNFDNLEIPEEDVLGKVGEGYKYAIGSLNEGRIGIGAQMVGLAQGCLDLAIPYTVDRQQFGQSIYDFQALGHQIARAVMKVELARLMVYNSGRMKEEGVNFVKEACMAKLYSSEIAQEVSSAAIDWMGGMGFVRDSVVEKFYRDAKIGTIYEGTSNIQLNTMAKLIKSEYM